jgi:hypothetical protein
MAGFDGAGGVTTFPALAIGDAVGAGTPGAVLFIDGSSNLGQDPAKILWDDTNFILKFPAEGEAIQFGTSIQPFRMLTGHYVANATNDPYIALGYNIAGGVAQASNPITGGVAQHQVALESNYNPSGTFTQVEWNHDYWSPDGLTHRRGFLMTVRNDTYAIAWNHYADTYSWWESTGMTLWMSLNSTTLNVPGGTLSLNTGGNISQFASDGGGSVVITPGSGRVTIQGSAAAPATLGLSPGNGGTGTIVTVNELVTIAAAPTTVSSTTIPAGAILLSVSCLVTVTIPTATAFSYALTTAGTTLNTTAVGVANGFNNRGTAGGTPYLSTTNTVTITPNGTPANNSGRVRLCFTYYVSTPPTS